MALVVALAVARVDAQEVVQVVEQKNFQHGLVVSESESSVIYKVTFTKATQMSGQPSDYRCNILETSSMYRFCRF